MRSIYPRPGTGSAVAHRLSQVLQQPGDLTIFALGERDHLDAGSATQDRLLGRAHVFHQRIARRRIGAERGELRVEQQAEVRVAQRIADEQHRVGQQQRRHHCLERRVGMGDAAVVLAGEDHRIVVVDRAVRLEDEEGAVQQQGAVLGQLHPCRCLGDAEIAPACEGVLEQRVEIGGDDAGPRRLDDGAVCGLGWCHLARQHTAQQLSEADAAQQRAALVGHLGELADREQGVELGAIDRVAEFSGGALHHRAHQLAPPRVAGRTRQPRAHEQHASPLAQIGHQRRQLVGSAEGGRLGGHRPIASPIRRGAPRVGAGAQKRRSIASEIGCVRCGTHSTRGA